MAKTDKRGVIIGAVDGIDQIKKSPKPKKANTEGSSIIQPNLGKGRKKSGST